MNALLRDFVWKRRVTENTRILQDLGIDGDDADEFLEAVHRKFGSNFDGFVFATYFSNEEFGSGEGWLRRRGFADNRQPLTVGHLIDVVQRGSWFDPPVQDGSYVKGSQWRRRLVRGWAVMRFSSLYIIAALGFGEGVGETIGLARGLGLMLFGLPIAAALATHMWRRLPAN